MAQVQQVVKVDPSEFKTKSLCDHPGKVCFERLLPRDEHLIKPPPPPPGVPDDVELIAPLDAVGNLNKLWHKDDLYVYFMVSHPQEQEILRWASEWSDHCAVQWHKVDDAAKSDIRVDFKENMGSWAYIGTDSKYIPRESQTMNLGFIDRATVLHEFGHTLGLIHEHQSPFDRGFEWNREKVIQDMMGPPNHWNLERIEKNFFERFKRSDFNGTEWDPKSIMHYSFPPEWIKGDGFPRGIEQNTELSDLDKTHVRKLYGPPRPHGHTREPVRPTPPQPRPNTGPFTLCFSCCLASIVPSDTGEPVLIEPTSDASRIITGVEGEKPVTSLPPPRAGNIYDVSVFKPHRGELSGPGAELLVRFRTDKVARPQYTIQTHGDVDMVVALLGPDDYNKLIRVSDDDAGDGKNAKIVIELMADRDYFLQIRTFKSVGGKFEFSIIGW